MGIPVLNEGQRFLAQIERMAGEGVPALADVAIFDGGSTDGSVDPGILTRSGVRAVLIKTGPGRLSAQLRMGYAWAMVQGYDGIVTVDGNGKDDTAAIPDFLEKLDAGWDLVQGSRYVPGGRAINTPLLRKLAIRTVHVPLTRMAAGFPYTDTTNGFRGYSRRLLLDPRVQPFREVFRTYELLAYMSVRAPRLGFRVVETPVSRAYPTSGPIPTKIAGWRGNVVLLGILLKAVTGRFNPEEQPATDGK